MSAPQAASREQVTRAIGLAAATLLAVGLVMAPTANLDAGVQLSHQRFGSIGTVHFGGSTTYAAKVGITLGLPR